MIQVIYRTDTKLGPVATDSDAEDKKENTGGQRRLQSTYM